MNGAVPCHHGMQTRQPAKQGREAGRDTLKLAVAAAHVVSQVKSHSRQSAHPSWISTSIVYLQAQTWAGVNA